MISNSGWRRNSRNCIRIEPAGKTTEFFVPDAVEHRYHCFMSLKEQLDDNVSLVAEFFRFVRKRKRYWLLPFLILVLLLSVFIVLTESSAFAPFIYSLF